MNCENTFEQNVKASMKAVSSLMRRAVLIILVAKRKWCFRLSAISSTMVKKKSDVRLISVTLLTQLFELLVFTRCMTL